MASPGDIARAATQGGKRLREMQLVIAAAEALYDNRLGWDEGRAPYAPRSFWAALGITLGRDMSWIGETAVDEEDGLITRNAALALLDELEAKSEKRG